MLFADVSKFISAGLVVGWFQGQMEWGLRALSNLLILGDPRCADLNVQDWFESDDDLSFLLQLLSIQPDRRRQVPAATHVQ